MKVIRTGALMLAALLGAALFASAPAAAQSWTGCWLTGAAGGTFAKTEVGLFGTSLDGLGQEGLAARAGGGCNMQLKDSPIVLGVGGDYTYQNPEINLAGLLKAGLDESWTVYGRLGVAMGNVMPYVLAGYTQTDWHINVPGVSTDPLKGWTVGAGLDWRIAPQFTLGPEYRFTRYDEQSIGPIQLNTDQHTVMIVGRFNLQEMFK